MSRACRAFFIASPPHKLLFQEIALAMAAVQKMFQIARGARNKRESEQLPIFKSGLVPSMRGHWPGEGA